jgi:hypothetical protein
MLDVKRRSIMSKARMKHQAAVGVAEFGNSAVLVTIAEGGEALDRRRIDLTRALATGAQR